MLNYKGYSGQLEIDEAAGIIFGRVLDIRDVVTFKKVSMLGWMKY